MDRNEKENVNGVNGSSPSGGRGTAPGRGRVPGNQQHQGSPGPSSSDTPKKYLKKIRVLSWNVGTMTGKSREIVEVMKRRKVNLACVQEVRWKGERARDVGEGYKIYYAGEKSGRNGVGVIVSSDLVDSVVEVKRCNSRLMKVKLVWEGVVVNVVCAYAPQVGLSDEEKEEFWTMFDTLVSGVNGGEKLLVGGDLNGHVGKESGGFSAVHGGWGYGSRNKEGEAILEEAVMHGLVILNTMFKKREGHLVTYESGGRRSQVDYIMTRVQDKRSCKNCKVLPGEGEEQHKIVVADMVWRVHKEVKRKTGVDAIKWGKLREKERELREHLVSKVNWAAEGDVENLWGCVAGEVKKICGEVLGVSKGGKTMINKETWWWEDEVQVAVKEKKHAFKEWKTMQAEDLLRKYREAKKAAKRAVAVAKGKKYDELYERLGTREGEKDVHRIAKSRARAQKDVVEVRCVKDEAGEVLVRDREIQDRWRRYFAGLMNDVGESEIVEQVEKRVEEEQEVEPVTLEEVKCALRKMEAGKAVGPDGIPGDVWKLVGEKATTWLQGLFNRMLLGEQMPREWRESWVVPLYKGKGEAQDCKNYRGIKLMSHTMKLWERVIEGRLRRQTEVSGIQFGFMPGKSTTEPIFMLRQMMEKYRRARKKMHVVFVDLEKAYDRVQRGVVWEVLNKRKVDEAYVRIVKDMYEGATTKIKTRIGVSDSFEVRVGVHQGSALSPYLFILVLDELLKGVVKEVPWCMLFADDMVLMADSEQEVERLLEQVRSALESKGLRVNREKTEHMESRWKGEQEGTTRVRLQEVLLNKVKEFKYLGAYVEEGGELNKEIEKKVQAGWGKWREASGVLCDKRMPLKLKGKYYSAVVRPVMTYSSECWAVKKCHVQKLSVAEMKMLRMMCGVTRRDRVRNEYVRASVGIDSIEDKLAQKRLRWLGHVIRKEEEDVVKKVWRVDSEIKLSRGRPEQTWDAVVRKDMKKRGLTEEWAQDRAGWRQAIRIPTLVKQGDR